MLTILVYVFLWWLIGLVAAIILRLSIEDKLKVQEYIAYGIFGPLLAICVIFALILGLLQDYLGPWLDKEI